MKRYLSILFFVLAFLSTAHASAPGELWQKGNQAYQQKQYDSAAFFYEQLAALQPTAIVYYNLGNVYYRANKIGPAVLNYERALHLQPGFKEAEDNLLLTQARIGNRVQTGQDIFFVRLWNSVTSGSKANLWAVVNILVLILLLGAILLKRFRNPSWLRPQVTGALVLVWLVFLVIAIQSAGNATRHDAAIVIQGDTPLINDTQAAKTQSLLPEGTKVFVIGKKGGRTEVKLGDGRTGWVQDSAIAVI